MHRFDFSGYVNVPSGWRIERNDDELWLTYIKSNRTYVIKSPGEGVFTLSYRSYLGNSREDYIMRSDSLYHILKCIGCLIPQPSMTHRTQLTLGQKRG